MQHHRGDSVSSSRHKKSVALLSPSPWLDFQTLLLLIQPKRRTKTPLAPLDGISTQRLPKCFPSHRDPRDLVLVPSCSINSHPNTRLCLLVAQRTTLVTGTFDTLPQARTLTGRVTTATAHRDGRTPSPVTRGFPRDTASRGVQLPLRNQDALRARAGGGVPSGVPGPRRRGRW